MNNKAHPSMEDTMTLTNEDAAEKGGHVGGHEEALKLLSAKSEDIANMIVILHMKSGDIEVLADRSYSAEYFRKVLKQVSMMIMRSLDGESFLLRAVRAVRGVVGL